MTNRLKEIRTRKGLTQHQLASLVNTTAQQIGRLENGSRRLTIEWINRLAKALNISHEVFFEENSNIYPFQNQPKNQDIISVNVNTLKETIYSVSLAIDEYLTRQKKELSSKEKAALIAKICPAALKFNEKERMERINDLADVLTDTISF